MPNIKSAGKRLLQNEKRRLRNRTRLVATRNFVKRLLKTSDKTQATQMLPKAVSLLDKLAKYNIIHKNNAANHKSSIVKYVNKLQ